MTTDDTELMAVSDIDWPADKLLTLTALRRLAREPSNGRQREWRIFLSHDQADAAIALPGFISVAQYSPWSLARLEKHEFGRCERSRFFFSTSQIEQT